MTSSASILICTDLDRTLLPNGPQDESIDARTLFKKLVTHPQIRLAYVSGRDRGLVMKAIQEYDIPIPDYALTDVGSNIYNISENNWQSLQGWHDELSLDWGAHNQASLAGLLDDLKGISLQEQHKQGQYKLSYYADPKMDTVNLFREINTRFHNREIHANLIWSVDETTDTGLLDILPAAANKLHAIHFLIKSLAISNEQVVFSGDSGNDLEVLCSEIPATLVANATEEVKQQALELCSTNNTLKYLYQAKGDFLGMNGNYAAGILEGIAHYHPEIKDWLS